MMNMQKCCLKTKATTSETGAALLLLVAGVMAETKAHSSSRVLLAIEGNTAVLSVGRTSSDIVMQKVAVLFIPNAGFSRLYP